LPDFSRGVSAHGNIDHGWRAIIATVKWRALIWLAVAASAVAAAGLAADVIAAGLAQAAALAGVVTGFCELGALTLGIVGWSAGRQDTSHQGEPGPSETPEDDRSAPTAGSAAGKYTVDARWARGVQVGDQATQHNHFRRSAAAAEPGGDR
jgi:hypothetical protein